MTLHVTDTCFNCIVIRLGLVAWQLRLFLTATFLVDSFLHCCGPLQNTYTEKRVEGSSSLSTKLEVLCGSGASPAKV
ncbi:hypothetical protein L2E82_33430 [Cichorium intybus]|uniref:Uncharacterized protein n=1 Tax=Cichorium intybus TaxID=13427 RepID=A0ACB9BK73_CICIN|nr:hypothetical protein L2E82_33430 [Cichorium intybus]